MKQKNNKPTFCLHLSAKAATLACFFASQALLRFAGLLRKKACYAYLGYA
jgi:hypothetical protein